MQVVPAQEFVGWYECPQGKTAFSLRLSSVIPAAPEQASEASGRRDDDDDDGDDDDNAATDTTNRAAFLQKANPNAGALVRGVLHFYPPLPTNLTKQKHTRYSMEDLKAKLQDLQAQLNQTVKAAAERLELSANASNGSSSSATSVDSNQREEHAQRQTEENSRSGGSETTQEKPERKSARNSDCQGSFEVAGRLSERGVLQLLPASGKLGETGLEGGWLHNPVRRVVLSPPLPLPLLHYDCFGLRPVVPCIVLYIAC
jgi:hypothetical protein